MREDEGAAFFPSFCLRDFSGVSRCCTFGTAEILRILRNAIRTQSSAKFFAT